MLDEKPWRMEAVLRLFMSVILSTIFLGALGVLAVHGLMGPAKPNTVLMLTITAGAFGCFVGALFLVGRPWPMERVVLFALLLLLCIWSGLLLMWGAMRLHGKETDTGFSISDMIVAVVFFQCAALVWIFRFLREHGMSWSEAFGLRRGRIRPLLLGWVTAVAVFITILVMQQGILHVLNRLHLKAEEQLTVQVVRAAQGWNNWLVLGMATILIAPVAEEMLFRGILYPAIKHLGFPRLALWVTSLLFATVHLNLAAFLPLTFLALVLAWLYERTGNLMAPIAAHSLFNALNFVLMWAQPWLEEKFPHMFQP